MRVLHTSDWHIGRKLYDRSLLDEHKKFFNWLIALIQTEKIDLLLVSGDIFDCAVPSGDSTKLYYNFLTRLVRETSSKAVITAGNHDSSAHIAAPKDLLIDSGIHVLGWDDDNRENPQTSLINLETLSIVAFPYIPEGELVSFMSLENNIDAAERYRTAIKMRYDVCLDAVPQNNHKIIMGHFFLQGSAPSDSERLVQIGGSTSVCVEDMPPSIDYAALGHLHRPQKMKGKDYPVVYSGSPLPMTFQEAKYKKKVFILELEMGEKTRVKEIEIPEFIKLRALRGSFDELLLLIDSSLADAVVDIELILDEVIPGAADKLKEAVFDVGGEVLRVIPYFKKSETEEKLSFNEICSLAPEHIFERFLDKQGVTSKEALAKTFLELLEIENNG